MLESAALGEPGQGLDLTERKRGAGIEHPLCAKRGTIGFPLSSHVIYLPFDVEGDVPTFQ